MVRRIVRFQEHLFSSHRVKRLARGLNAEGSLPDVDSNLTPLEQQGKATFTEFCATCHGGPTLTVNTDARFLPVLQRGPLPGAQAFVNIFVQTPHTPPGPPSPPFFEGLPTANLEERTFLVTVPTGTQTIVTSDPGRGAITGEVREFGRFDVPTLFGAARTAPYFHDDSAATLGRRRSTLSGALQPLQPADVLRRRQPVRAAGERTGVHCRRMRNPSASGWGSGRIACSFASCSCT